uniref:Uncharacterized protein n=1 Tax=Glossina pallidipes TaxID=7398 RepID=A0A1A9ZX44_GLOPL
MEIGDKYLEPLQMARRVVESMQIMCFVFNDFMVSAQKQRAFKESQGYVFGDTEFPRKLILPVATVDGILLFCHPLEGVLVYWYATSLLQYCQPNEEESTFSMDCIDKAPTKLYHNMIDKLNKISLKDRRQNEDAKYVFGEARSGETYLTQKLPMAWSVVREEILSDESL